MGEGVSDAVAINAAFMSLDPNAGLNLAVRGPPWACWPIAIGWVPHCSGTSLT